MVTEKRSTGFGAALIIFSVIFRLILGITHPVLGAIPQTEPTAPSNLPRETTGALRPHPTTVPTAPSASQPMPETTVPPPPPSWCFSAADLAYVRVQYAADCSYRPELEQLLLQPLPWDLTGEEPKVLILHTHASESYTRQSGEQYTESAAYRTLDTAYNMVAVGDYLAQLLTDAGIAVIHDRQIHDYPSYNQSYNQSRASVQQYLAQYPSIQVVLDLHRDAAENADGSQYATACRVNGETVAQLMLVVGTNASGNYHPAWQDNLAVAVKLQALLEQLAPGITRQTILRAQRFNQDLSSGALIVEVGTAGNSRAEAMGAIPFLAQALTQLMHGAG